MRGCFKGAIRVKIQRSHRIRLCPNNKQVGYFVRACGVSRFAYNWGLTEWKRQYASGVKPHPYALNKQFNVLKRKEYPFVLDVTKCAPTQAFIDLGKAFQNFFKNIKVGRKPGFPQFKRKGIHDSFYLANDQFLLDGRRVRIPKLGWVKMREVLRFDGKIMSATVSREADMWFISAQVEQDIPDSKATGSVIGVDVGIKTLAVVSDGRTYENPKALRIAAPRLRLLQKSVSRKQKGSNNRKKAVRRLQRQHYRVSCSRKDAIHKATSAITTGVSAIGIEDLHVKGMLKNRKLSKALSDASLSEFIRQLEYKARGRGVIVTKVDRFYPSSKTCSQCGSVKSVLRLCDRIYVCEICGLKIDRDLNAAINLKQMAEGSSVTACCLRSSGSNTG